jgi:hypothetical protein
MSWSFFSRKPNLDPAVQRLLNSPFRTAREAVRKMVDTTQYLDPHLAADLAEAAAELERQHRTSSE